MSLDPAITQLRQFAASDFLIDACTITRADATPTFDPNTGQYTADPASTVFEGDCFVPPTSVQDYTEIIAGEAERMITRHRVLLSHEAEGIQKGDILTLTACKHDPELIGRALKIEVVARDSVNIAQTLIAEDVT